MKTFCAQCNENIDKYIDKRNINNFCNSSCAAKFNNKNRNKDFYSKTKSLTCLDCKILFTTKSTSCSKKCQNCVKKDAKLKLNTTHMVICNMCSNEFQSRSAKYCDDCRHFVNQRSGTKAAASRALRSKNEIAFANLCISNYKNVSTNELFFKSETGFWDADVILHDYKIAVLWNGIWHYKQIKSNDHKFKQVQSRDVIKLKVIANNGYTPYVIKDMGKHNLEFVQNEFAKFKLYLEK